ncbi:MAG: NAD(P)/FAD-dependent oxidoreductase [Pseudomonadota bacterium]
MNERLSAVIIGTGFSGLCMAIRLKQSGIDDFVILERAGEVGGTWRDNHYPGCACDVQSHLYSYSFEPNPDWSRQFAPQSEIWSYLRRCAEKYGILPHIRYDANVVASRFDAETSTWVVSTEDGREFRGQVMVSGAGALSNPFTPKTPGSETFAGEMFHSAEWRHDLDLRGKRVAVIGSGASAIQFVPQIAPKVGQLDYFQRTAPWVMPKPDWQRSVWAKRLTRRVPLAQKLHRWGTYWILEARVLGFVISPQILKVLEVLGRRHINQHVKDPAKRAALTPNFSAGCKRVLVSNDYYPALARDNVRIVTQGIARITPKGVVTADGVEHPADVIIWGTGFRVQELVPRGAYTGQGGRDLAEVWGQSGGPEAYLGMTVAGFPNLFFMMGPNTGLGHSSMVYMIESQAQYVLDAILKMKKARLEVVDVRPEVQQGFVANMQSRLKGTVWASGCKSWYLNDSGKNTTLWPGFTFGYRQVTRSFNLGDYVVKSKS